MEGSKEQVEVPPIAEKQPLLRKFVELIKHVMDPNLGPKKLSLEEIGRPEVVAGVILREMHPLQGRFGRSHWENGFSLVTLLSNMGHGPVVTTRDYFAKLSEKEKEYFYALRGTLRELSGEGKPLVEYPLEKPDAHGETVHYKVVDEELLRKIV